MKDLIFDFDGTVVDTGRGIMNCVVKVFEHYGLPVPTPAELRTFVGPPLKDTFPRYGIPVQEADAAVAYFRQHYAATGKDECEPYAGIGDTLATLVKMGFELHIGTSKPEHFALLLLERFGLKKYFTHIVGATTDGTREKKVDVLKCLVQKIGHTDALMVGDTHYDVEGARLLGMDTVGVSWGYEAKDDLQRSGAVYVAATQAELVEYLKK